MKKSTYYVKNFGLAKKPLSKLTSHVKKTMSEAIVKAGFGAWLDDQIDAARLKKKDVAKEAGIQDGSLSRILKGQIGVKTETAIALINAVNSLANRTVADMETGLLLAAGVDLASIRTVPAEVKAMFGAYDINKWSPEKRRRIFKHIKSTLANEAEEGEEFEAQ